MKKNLENAQKFLEENKTTLGFANRELINFKMKPVNLPEPQRKNSNNNVNRMKM